MIQTTDEHGEPLTIAELKYLVQFAPGSIEPTAEIREPIQLRPEWCEWGNDIEGT